MDRRVTRAGRQGVCPACGSNQIKRVWIRNQDKVTCIVCGNTVRPCKVSFPQHHTDTRRVYNAVDFLNSQTGKGVSRLDVARHLGISKHPGLLKQLGFLVNAGALLTWSEVSPDNGREMIVYAPWVAKDTPQDDQDAMKGTYKGKGYPTPPKRRRAAPRATQTTTP